jgi:hypothetical protein
MPGRWFLRGSEFVGRRFPFATGVEALVEPGGRERQLPGKGTGLPEPRAGRAQTVMVDRLADQVSGGASPADALGMVVLAEHARSLVPARV